MAPAMPAISSSLTLWPTRFARPLCKLFQIITMNKSPLPEEEQEKYLVPGLERGLRLLCEFNRHDKSLSAPELARRLKVPRSTVFRLLATLERMGFVERNDSGRDFRLGMSVLRLGFEYLASLELTELGRPLLDRLRDEISYPCNL